MINPVTRVLPGLKNDAALPANKAITTSIPPMSWLKKDKKITPAAPDRKAISIRKKYPFFI
jgi:hypothetical protein